MISKEHRFHGLGSLRFVYGRGEASRGQLFLIRYAKNPRRKTYRAAVVVSKKVHKSAVVRNRIRRRIYEIIREYEPRIKEPYDIAVIVHSDQVATVPSTKLHQQMERQLQGAEII